eukprot:SAG31_NODE_6106_length_2170_cov_1.131338_1_plen_201_part_00
MPDAAPGEDLSSWRQLDLIIRKIHTDTYTAEVAYRCRPSIRAAGGARLCQRERPPTGRPSTALLPHDKRRVGAATSAAATAAAMRKPLPPTAQAHRWRADRRGATRSPQRPPRSASTKSPPWCASRWCGRRALRLTLTAIGLASLATLVVLNCDEASFEKHCLSLADPSLFGQVWLHQLFSAALGSHPVSRLGRSNLWSD